MKYPLPRTERPGVADVRRCSIDGCERTNLAVPRLCWMHYRRRLRTGEVGPAESLQRTSGEPRPETCTAEDCGRRHFEAGYCTTHYLRLRTKGNAGGPIRRFRTQGCEVDGCTRPHHSRGWCRRHYERWKYGSAPTGIYVERGTYEACTVEGCERAHKACTVEGCERAHKARGYCLKHYYAIYYRQARTEVA